MDEHLVRVIAPDAGGCFGIKMHSYPGEAGTCAAAAAVLDAVNDASRPLGAKVSRLPITPQVILDALAQTAPMAEQVS